MNRRRIVVGAGSLIAMAGRVQAQGDPIAAAVADAMRPAADREADARRKPAQTLAFAQVRPGMKVAELFPGGGYFSRMLSRVVGKGGQVWLIPWQEPQSGRTRRLATDPVYGNFTYVDGNLFGFRPGEPLDMVFTVQNYHDITSPQRAQVNQLIHRWLKPGGAYVIVDHAAVDGSGYATLPLHRIDEALVKKEVTAAGFVLAGESQALRNPKDDRKTNVFDPAIRGRTDQFMLRFVKP